MENNLVRDAISGLYHIEDMPNIAEIDNKYENCFYSIDHLDKVKKEYAYWKNIWTLRLNLMENAVVGNKSILDIGAGGGFFLHVAKTKGWQCFGVEPSKLALSYAKKEFQIDLIEGFLESLTPVKNKVNAIHLAFVLEHIRKPGEFIEKALAWLSPGGVMWIEVPNEFNPLQKVITSKLRKKQWWIVPEHHINYFNYDSLASLICQFRVQELDRIASFPMELFALMGHDYIDDHTVGYDVHKMRMSMENNILNSDPNIILSLYRELAKLKLGRTCNLLVRKL